MRSSDYELINSGTIVFAFEFQVYQINLDEFFN